MADPMSSLRHADNLHSCYSQLMCISSFLGHKPLPGLLRHSLGLVRRSRLVDELELSSKAVRPGVLQQTAHGVGVQVSDQLTNPPDLVGSHRFIE